MNYYFYDSKSPWAIVLSDINDMVTLNVGINQISTGDLNRIGKIQDVTDAIDDGILEICSNDKDPKPLSELFDPLSKSGKGRKYIESCFCKDTLRVWKSRLEAQNRHQLVRATDMQMERLS